MKRIDQRINGVPGILLSNIGEMGVACGGGGAGMAQ